MDLERMKEIEEMKLNALAEALKWLEPQGEIYE